MPSDSQEFAFRGVLVPVITPFDSDLRPNSRRFSQFCRWLLDQGAAGLAVFGTTSEANSLAIEERIELLDALIDAGVPAPKLMPGTGTCALADSIRLSRHAVEAGCGGVLVLPPFYYKGVSEDGLYAAYSELIQGVADSRLQVYLYHIPQMTQVPISLTLIERLHKDYPATVVGIKDSSGDWGNTQAILREFPRLRTYLSSESRLLEALRLGGSGCISASANINVATIARLAANWQGAEAKALHESVSALRSVVEAYPVIAAVKHIVAHYSGDTGWATLRPPLDGLSAAQAHSLIETLNGMDYKLGFGA